MKKRTQNAVEAKLLRAVRRNLDEDAPRLRYADAIERREPGRAEFIRLQCGIAELEPCGDRYWALKERELDLLAKYGPAWRSPCGVFGETAHVSFTRGFVDNGLGRFDWESFRASAGKLLKIAPAIQELSLLCETAFPNETGAPWWELKKLKPVRSTREIPPGLEGLPIWRQIAKLSLIARMTAPFPITAQQAAKLFNSATFPRLRGIHLNVRHTRAGQQAIARCDAWQGLREVSINCDSPLEDLDRLFPERLRQHLEVLDLQGCDSAARLLSSRDFPALRSLRISSLQLTDSDMASVVKRGPFRALQSLALQYNLTARGVAAVLGAPWSHELKKLSLEGNPAGDATFALVARSPAMATLRELEIGTWNSLPNERQASRSAPDIVEFCQARAPGLWRLAWFGPELTAAHVRALIAAPWWPQLRAFGLHVNATPAAQVMLGQNWPPYLEQLEVGFGTQLGDDGLMRLVPASREFAKLRVLRLPNCNLAGASVSHLAISCRLPRLLELDLSWNVLSGFAKFLKSPLAKGLRVLNLEDTTGIGVAGFKAMLDHRVLPHLSEVRMNGIDHEIEFVYDELEERYGDRLRF